MQRAVAIIPARFNSVRFTGKPLALLKNKPVIQHVYENVTRARLVERVLVATDDERICDAVKGFGGTAVMTSVEHMSGTDRIAEAARDIECDIVVNVQGDEPFIRPDMVDAVVDILRDDERAKVSTLAKRLTDIRDLLSSDVVKVVLDNEGFALYFSRSPIPFVRDAWHTHSKDIIGNGDWVQTLWEMPVSHTGERASLFLKHIGIYGYRKRTLIEFTTMGSGILEMTEKLEQLRLLAGGKKIKVGETDRDTLGIDTKEDLKRGEEWLNTYS